ncbi:MAG: hypothetical protein HYY67_08885 [Thaumarchaeota archaeon]|nr:hypothetical protein [Nitrososphaerota archaeon]
MKTRNSFRVFIPVIIAVLALSSLSFATFPTVSASRSGEPTIAVISAPTKANPGQKLTFTWEIDGFGRISHTAVHWDTKPGNPADYKSYANATPDFASINPPDLAPKRYTATIEAPQSGSIFWIVHAILDGFDTYNMEGQGIIPVGTPNAAIVPRSVPATASPGEKLTFGWEITGSGKISHTAVHWDTKLGNPADFKSYAKATPDYVAIDPPHDAPHGYSVTVEAPQGTAMHYVIHAIVDGKDLYITGGERVITLKVASVAPVEQKPTPAKETTTQGAGVDNTTLMLAAGAAIVVVAVGVVAIARRKKSA